MIASKLLSVLTTSSILAFGVLMPVAAQVIPDGTTSTTVDADGTINDGNRAGGNLFHSFQEFSVPDGGRAFFNNALDIVNIFSRVTGGNISNINGFLGANGTANLFLINPAGIIFGESARLSIGGSFFGSTADSIIFSDGEFSALDADNPPLLTVNAPLGLGIRDNPGDITINGNENATAVADFALLSVAEDQSINLIGGNLDLNDALLVAPGGRVELGGLSTSETVGINEDGSLNFPDNLPRGNVSLNNSQVRVDFTSDGEGGSININANNFELLSASNLQSEIDNFGFDGAQAGDININATGAVNLSGASTILNQVIGGATGNSGDINITASSFSIVDGARISTATFSQGNAGNINLNIQGQAEIIDGNLFSNVASSAVGDGGTISIQANSLSLLQGSQIQTSINQGGQGNAGNVVIDVDGEILISGIKEESISAIFSLTESETIGNTGDITITAGSLSIEDGAFLRSNTFGQGDGGQVMITANTLFLTEGGAIRTSTFGQGNAGNIIVNADDSVNISGVAPFLILEENTVGGFSSGLLASTEAGAGGQGGEIIVNTPKLSLSDGGVISARSRSDFAGGNITVNADILEILGGGQIQAAAFSNESAGNINLNIKNQITIDGSDPTFQDRFNSVVDAIVDRGIDEETANTIATSAIDPVSAESGVFANTISGSQGDGGNITIGIFDAEGNLDTTQFTDEVNLSNQGTIAADSAGSGSGGTITIRAKNINLDLGTISATTTSLQKVAIPSLSTINLFVKDNLILSNNSTISAEATNNADGGNINIDSGFVIGFPSRGLGSDIRANAVAGTGGNIKIITQGLLGFVESKGTAGKLNDTNDIDASSEFGLDGIVIINSPDTNPLQRTDRLPTNPVSAETIATESCSPRGGGTSLTYKGKGGAPPEPTAPFTADALIPDGKPITVDKEKELTALTIEENQTSQEELNYNYIPDDIKPFKTDNGYIYPARGVIIREDGTVTLTTYPTNNKHNRVPKTSANCNSSSYQFE
ncbi:MAG: filamentous hemagglutinin N-terminal domain-containing protein [Xenococcus sp. MO_188.B8]|nr:filamentous hemagglutinin N-terminal domain-containing protein [Xenococcus sp. MO_188.B8]